MATHVYAILDATTGETVGQQTCEGDTCFPQLVAGQVRGGELTDATGAPAALQVTRINADGTLAQPIAPAPPATTRQDGVPVQQSVQQSLGAIPATFTPVPSGTSYGNPTALAPVQYASPPPSFGAPPPQAGMLPSMQNIPPYQNGQLHPAAGGQPLVPGGMFNQNQNQGQEDNRQQVYVPGGAAAGPFQTRAAEAPRGGNANYGGSGGGGGGGGSLAKSMYWRIRNQVESKLSGMGPGGSSGSSSYRSYGSSSSNQYARQQKKISRAYDKYNHQLQNPPPQKAHGWAKDVLGKNKGNYPLMLSNPMMVAGAMGLDGSDQGTRGSYDFLSSLPVGDLAMITGGTTGKGLTRKTPVIKPPHILEQQKGFKPVKPEFKRTLDYSKYAEQLAKMYLGLNSERGNILDMTSLMGNLAGASQHGALRQGIRQQAKYDQSGALDRARGYFDSIFSATQDPGQAAVYAAMADRYFNDPSLLHKGPKHISQIVPTVARMFT